MLSATVDDSFCSIMIENLPPSQIRRNFLFVGFRTDWLRREQAMKTAGRGTQNCYATVRSKASSWSGRLEQPLLNYTGWKTRKHPAAGEFFFLTFPFIELRGTWPLI